MALHVAESYQEFDDHPFGGYQYVVAEDGPADYRKLVRVRGGLLIDSDVTSANLQQQIARAAAFVRARVVEARQLVLVHGANSATIATKTGLDFHVCES